MLYFKSREYLQSICKKINIKLEKNITRSSICELIKNKFLELEKYSTGKDKITYVIIPFNHKKYKFPYNLEDRKDYIISNIKNKFKNKLSKKISTLKFKAGDYKNKPKKIIISIKNNSELNSNKNFY